MADYIDIDAPIDVAVYQRNRRIKVTLRQILESNDAKYERADVRPVVLCRDCEYYQADCGWCGWFDIGMNVKDFCSWGKKREES